MSVGAALRAYEKLHRAVHPCSAPKPHAPLELTA